MSRLKTRFFLNMKFAREIAVLSTCDRAHVGAVVYNPKTKRIMGMGYNGALPDHPHCDDAGHLMIEGHCCRTIHAEVNALDNAKDTEGCILFVTHFPCIHCAKTLASRGIKGVIYENDYRILPETAEVLQQQGISFWSMEEAMARPEVFLTKAMGAL